MQKKEREKPNLLFMYIPASTNQSCSRCRQYNVHFALCTQYRQGARELYKHGPLMSLRFWPPIFPTFLHTSEKVSKEDPILLFSVKATHCCNN